MNDLVNSVNTTVLSGFVRDTAWQSTIVLAFGLLAARGFARQPARLHAVLVLASCATLVAPIASHFVRQHGWGMLAPAALAAVAPPKPRIDEIDTPQDPATANGQAPIVPVASVPAMPSGGLTPIAHDLPALKSFDRSANAPASVETEKRSVWGQIVTSFAIGWLAATVIALIRLLRGAWAGIRLVAAAQPCADPGVTEALVSARRQLGLERITISIYQTDAVHCPLIWCWGRRPRVLVPCNAVRDWTAAQWSAVLCHELAHLKRRDHWATLLSETVCCLLPWQPLVWWTKRRLETAAEQACDDWTLAAGHSATDYAETLLDLVAQAGPPLALAALRRPSGTAGRIRHILTQAVPRPRRGWAWGLFMLAIASVGVGATALCQRGVLRAEPAAPAMKGRMAAGSKGAIPSLADSLAKDDKPRKFNVHGRLLRPDGQPMPGAQVIWEVMRRKPNRNDNRWDRTEEARTQTDGQGQFACETELVVHDVLAARLIFVAVGFGLTGYTIASDALESLAKPIEAQLEETYPVEGTIFTPSGEPVKDAQVIVWSITNYAPKESSDVRKQWFLSISDDEVRSLKPRDYWPAPVTTDAEGHFRLEGIVARSASMQLIVVAKGFVNTRVHVAHKDSQGWAGLVPREPTFTLVLENPYVVEGQFVDDKTGQPIPNTRVEVMPMMNSRGGQNIDTSVATSDANGRYTLLCGSADTYFVKIFPPLGYAGVDNSFSAEQVKRLAGTTRKIKYPLKLRAGLVLRGRVVDATTGGGVANADVLYRPAKGRKLGINSDFNSVKTSADGSFEVTGADGKGALLVDAPGQGFYRLVDVDKESAAQGYYQEFAYPHGKLEIEVPADGQKEPLLVPLQRGPELVAQVVTPDGEPVKKMMVTYHGLARDSSLNGELISGSVFRIEAAEPGRKYRVAFYAEDSQSGKVVELAAPADGKPLEIKLDPCATIRGRYVYDGSVPAPEVTNFSHFSLDADHQGIKDDKIFALPFYDNFARHRDLTRISDANGDFESKGIVPGLFMYLSINYRLPDGKTYKPVGVLSPGETRDMGEMVIQP